jgi:hypothetical protein
MKIYLFNLFGTILVVVSRELPTNRALSYRLAALRDWPSSRNYPAAP